jgi:hypothetical protein
MDKRTLSELGEDYKNFNPSGDGLLRIVQNWGNELSENLRNTLRKSKTNASSVLSQSIGSIAKPKQGGFKLTVEMESYYRYVEDGRKAGKRPPIQSIYEWIQNKKSVQTLISRSTDRVKATRSLAYVISKKIAKHGTKAQPFIRQNVNDKSLQVLSDRIGEYIGKQLAGD